MMQLIGFILKPYFVFDDDFNVAVWSFFQSHGLHMKYVSYAMLNTLEFITFVYNDQRLSNMTIARYSEITFRPII